MIIKDIVEAFEVGNMPNITSNEYQEGYAPLLAKSAKIADVRANLELFLYSNRIYLLVKDKTTVLGNLTLSPKLIAGKQYMHIDVIFVDPAYRKTSALYWLVYATKEVVTDPVIADGAIFKDGIALIDAVKKHKMFNVFKLGKYSGSKTELDGPINNSDYCYLFETTNLGFGKQIFVESIPYTWYPLFEEII